MADSAEGDTEVQDLGLLASTLIALIAGLVIHSFIIGVNVNDCWKGRSVTPVDHIMTYLGILRMCTQCVNTLYLFVDILSMTHQQSLVSLGIMKAVFAFFTYANMWSTALLSIVFCLKISNLRARLFLYLRRVIAQRTVHFIVASALLSAFNCFSFLLISITEMIKGATYNTTMANVCTDCTCSNYIYSFSIGASIPLLLYCISAVLLFNSLYLHTTRMKMSSNLSINLEKYYSVMKFLSFTFIYNTIYFIGHFFGVFYYNIYCVTHPWLYIFMDFLPILHSSYLIYRTAKLRKQMSKVLQNVINFLFQRKNTGTRENIEVVAQ